MVFIFLALPLGARAARNGDADRGTWGLGLEQRFNSFGLRFIF